MFCLLSLSEDVSSGLTNDVNLLSPSRLMCAEITWWEVLLKENKVVVVVYCLSRNLAFLFGKRLVMH